jgi:glycosyltransferase involved in cell wall biosynthesis
MDKSTLIVVPCFNEEKRISVPYWEELIKLRSDISWVFVNDGSTDGTSHLLSQITFGTDASIIECDRNLGKGNAIRLGLSKSLKSYRDLKALGYLDADGAFSPFDVLRLVDKFYELLQKDKTSRIDALISSRVALAGHQISRKASRHYIGRIIATYITRDWEGAPYDTQSGFKLFTKSKSLETGLLEEFKTSWFIDVELLARIGMANGGDLVLWEEPLTSWQDVSGSNLKFRKAPALVREILIARRAVRKLTMSRG